MVHPSGTFSLRIVNRREKSQMPKILDQQITDAALAAVNSISDGIITVDLDSHITFLNPAAETLTGWTYIEASGRPSCEIFRIVNAITGETDWHPLIASIEDDERYTLLPNSVLIRKDGSEIQVEDATSPLHDQAGQVCGAAIVFRDVSLTRLMLQKALHRAHHDPLTTLPTRTLLHERIRQALAALRGRGHLVALLFIDLDGFKEVNDTFGHAAGDHVLKVLAKRMTGCVRSSDTICRIGGDEFVVLLPDMNNTLDVERIAAKLLEKASIAIPYDGSILKLSLSIGMVTQEKPQGSASSLLQNADAAMYQAKELGGNRSQWFTPELNLHTRERGSLEDELRQALDQNHLALHYQPQVDLRSGKIIGAEALLRWRTSDGSILFPLSFIPTAEKSGLIVPVGQMVLRKALRQQRLWREQGVADLLMTVNVSALELRHDDYLSTLNCILLEEAYVPGSLMLELTESVLLQAEQEKDIIPALRQKGLLLAIDDFGMGYSNLNYLRRFATNMLKVDRSFITDIASNEQDASLVQAMISMGRSLDKVIIAEGVETAEQLHRLRELSCDQAQGYFFSPPVPAESFAELIERRW